MLVLCFLLILDPLGEGGCVAAQHFKTTVHKLHDTRAEKYVIPAQMIPGVPGYANGFRQTIPLKGSIRIIQFKTRQKAQLTGCTTRSRSEVLLNGPAKDPLQNIQRHDCNLDVRAIHVEPELIDMVTADLNG